MRQSSHVGIARVFCQHDPQPKAIDLDALKIQSNDFPPIQTRLYRRDEAIRA